MRALPSVLRARGARAFAACLLGAVAWLGGCAGQGVAPGGGEQELRTASDQTENEKRARARPELASAYFERGQTDVALDELKQALAALPTLGEAYNLRGLIYASLGEPRLADESFQRALQLNARDGDAKHNYGWFLCQQSRFADAQAHFSAALATPQYRGVPRTLLAQGVCQARDNRLPEAEATLMRAYELDTANPTIAINLAEVLYLRGNYERARFYVRRINQQPETVNAQSLWLAARIEQRVGNRAGVQEFGKQLRERYPQAPQTLSYERGRFDD